MEEKEYVVYRTPLGTILLDWNGCLWKYGYPAFSKHVCKEIERGYSEGGRALAALYARVKVCYEKPHTKEEEASKFEEWKLAQVFGGNWKEEPFAMENTKNQGIVIRTPRGMFHLIEGERVLDLKTEGYGYHHEHGDYVVVCSLNRGVAVTKRDYERYFQK